MLSRILKRESQPVGRRHVSTLTKRMSIHALYRKPNTSKRHPAHKVYPYLPRNLEITRSNHVWATDITYIPMKRGFVYLFAVMLGLYAENIVANHLRRWPGLVELAHYRERDKELDFIVDLGSSRIGIEVKYRATLNDRELNIKPRDCRDARL